LNVDTKITISFIWLGPFLLGPSWLGGNELDTQLKLLQTIWSVHTS